ncbi:Lichenan permease IIC component [uncultured Eubacteriales bacterium]|uniref:Permease IIC component n=1 Tax=uncultured Eubacteriales bacterium TaxID=172733 RepID=A0A212KEM4_9FIRM|nr:Lichenan permease IIC component [uncultured Eubacteriales bacterium]
MGNFFDSKFMQALQRGGQKVAGNKAISALTGGMMGMMGVTMVGAIFQILAVVPTIFGWADQSSQYYQIMITPYNMTMGLMAVVMAFTLAFNYAKSLGLKPVVNGINSMLMFLMVAAPVKTVTLADGSTLAALDSSALGGTGLFAAILVAIVTVRITWFCEKKHITIKMPDVVPQFLSDGFSAMLPLLFSAILWLAISTIVSSVIGLTLPMAIMAILSIPLAYLNSVPGMLILVALSCTLWIFGIHGSMVVAMAIMPVMMQNVMANGAAVAAGQAPVFYATMLFGAMACAGGTGNTLPLVLMGLRSKSEQLRAVSKVALVPGIFNINEPLTFGFPIMYNPILAIPYIFGTVLTGFVVWAGYAVGFFQPGYIMMMSVMPLGVSEFLSSLAWQNIFIPVVGIVVNGLCYFPFFKAYEKQLLEKETAAAAVQ